MTDVTEEECTARQGVLHGRINERASWKIILWVLFIFFLLIVGSYGYTSTSRASVEAKQEKIEAKQWEFSEKMVTQAYFREFKRENNSKLDKIQASIESLRR